jgi:hypothetical protein
MEKINLEQVPHLSIQEMTVLPIEILLELESEAETKMQSAIRQRSWINGAIAIKELREKKAKNGGAL